MDSTNKTIISNSQGISIMTMFLIGSSIVIGIAKESKQDVWIAVPLAVLMVLPMLYIYSKLLAMFPDKSLYDILQEVFGKWLGKLICLLYVWYSFHLGAIVTRVFVEFVNVVSLPETPECFIIIMFGSLCIYFVRSGIEVMGRWSMFVMPMLLVIIIMLNASLVGDMQLINLKPILYNGMKPVAASAFAIFSFPLSQTAVFTMVFHSLENKDKIFKTFITSALIAISILTLSSMKNILVLGCKTYDSLYFPSYIAVRTLKVADFFERFEIVVAVVFIVAGFVKVSVCLYVASTGIAKVLGFKDHKRIAAPVGFLMMNLANILYNNAMELFDWELNVYKYYAFPFHVILPIITLIAAKLKINKKTSV